MVMAYGLYVSDIQTMAAYHETEISNTTKDPAPAVQKNHSKISTLAVVTAQPGGSQSKLAVDAVRQIRIQRSLDDATAGKLQDKIMHYMGYQDSIAAGTTYTFDEKTIDTLLYNAYVYDHEISFWRDYAHTVGLKS